MNKVDYLTFLVAGVCGVLGVDRRIPWAIVTVWSLVRLFTVLS